MKATWRPVPSRPDYISEDGHGVYCLGEEGEYIVCFQEITPERFIELVYEYEREVEQFDSRDEFDGAAYSQSDVSVVSCFYHQDEYGDWRLYWGPFTDEYLVKDRLVMKLSRW